MLYGRSHRGVSGIKEPHDYINLMECLKCTKLCIPFDASTRYEVGADSVVDTRGGGEMGGGGNKGMGADGTEGKEGVAVCTLPTDWEQAGTDGRLQGGWGSSGKSRTAEEQATQEESVEERGDKVLCSTCDSLDVTHTGIAEECVHVFCSSCVGFLRGCPFAGCSTDHGFREIQHLSNCTSSDRLHRMKSDESSSALAAPMDPCEIEGNVGVGLEPNNAAVNNMKRMKADQRMSSSASKALGAWGAQEVGARLNSVLNTVRCHVRMSIIISNCVVLWSCI